MDLAKIDFVLAYHEKKGKKNKREIFEYNLRKSGLRLEITKPSSSYTGDVGFVKISAPTSILNRHAKELNILKKLATPIRSSQGQKSKRNYQLACNKLQCTFQNDKETDTKEFPRAFTPAQRSYIVNEILLRIPYEQKIINEENILTEKQDSIITLTDTQDSIITQTDIQHSAITQTYKQDSINIQSIQRENMNEAEAPKPNYRNCTKNEISTVQDFPVDHIKLTPAQHAQVPARKRLRFGIKRLLLNGTYSASFTLHEELKEGTENNTRKFLYNNWVMKWFKFQPIEMVCWYFGEKIALYFSCLGFYTGMLTVPAIVGLSCFIYGLQNIKHDVISHEICDGTKSLLMCPLCEKNCQLWRLHDRCVFSRLAAVFDNPSTVFFALFMSLWSIIFLEMWKRKQVSMAWTWGTLSCEDDNIEPTRAEYERKANQYVRSPVTGLYELQLTRLNHYLRRCSSVLLVLCTLCVMIAALLSVILYRLAIISYLYENAFIQSGKIITGITAACFNLSIILILGHIYEVIAFHLTELECPRTKSQYDDSFVTKMFCLQFVNFYSSLFYVAFFKGNFGGFRNSITEEIRVFGYRVEDCDVTGCLLELSVQLLIIMFGKQIINNLLQITLPKIKALFRRHVQRKQALNFAKMEMLQSQEDESGINTTQLWDVIDKHILPSDSTKTEPCQANMNLDELPSVPLYKEYMDMVLQYGFITMFVSVFPLGPLLALFNNIIAMRRDAYKYTMCYRRQVMRRAKDIGIWYSILKLLTGLSVLVNSLVIGFNSQFIPKLVYYYKYGALQGFVNVTLSIQEMTYNNQSITCRYPGHQYPSLEDRSSMDNNRYNRIFWHVLSARLIFVLFFTNFVFLVAWIIDNLIPDIPLWVQNEMRKQRLRAEMALYNHSQEICKDCEINP